MIEIFEGKHLKPKVIFGWTLIAICVLAAFFIVYFFILPPKVVLAGLNNQAVGLSDNITVSFNKPISREMLTLQISPPISGQWQFSGSLLSTHLYKKATFIPDNHFNPDENYKIMLKNATGYINLGKSNNFELDFKTQSIPSIDHISVSKDQIDVSPSEPITVFLTEKNDKIVNFDFKFEPEVDFTPTPSNDSLSYSIKLNKPLAQGTKYSFSASKTFLSTKTASSESNENNFSLSFTTKEAPNVADYSPKGSLVPISTNQIAITFKEDMIKQELIDNISINPAIKGEWQWENNRKVVYNFSEKIPYNTSYAVSINKGVHDTLGGYLSNDIKLTFTTIGNVTVIDNYPKSGQGKVPTTASLYFTFNQNVEHSSAERLFSIKPAVDGSFSWSDNKMIFKPTGLAKDSSYEMSVASGVKSINGLDSAKSFTYSFTTEQSSTLLNVTVDLQDKALSCEAASLKMALQYKGANVSENDIMSIIGYDPTIRNGNIWGNPNNAFVGDINGKQNTTGYGVYWDPIAKAANNWRQATPFSGWTVQEAAKQLLAGNPIVVWGVTGGSIRRDDWQTPAGQTILAWKGEHARTLIGFEGSIENPTYFYLNDPYAGRIKWTRAKFESDWSTFGNSGVVVY